MSNPPLVVPPETWTRLPGTEWEVWHARKSVVIIGPHPKGTHGMAIRQATTPAPTPTRGKVEPYAGG